MHMFSKFNGDTFTLEILKDVRLKMVDIPFQENFTISGGTSGTSFNPIVVSITDESGNRGISTLDNFPNSSYDNHGTAVSWITLQEYIPILLSRCNNTECSILDVHALLHEIRDFNSFAVSALEMACFDLLGKEQGKPCHELFYTLFTGLLNEISKEKPGFISPESAALDRTREERIKNGLDSKISIGLKGQYSNYDAIISNAIKKGITAIKLKITPEPAYNSQLAKHVRSTFPEITMDTDANACFLPIKSLDGNYSLNEIINLYNSMDKFKIRMHEQPSYFKEDHLLLHERLAREIAVPLCPDESVHGFYEAKRFCEIARDLHKQMFLNVKVHRTGGLVTCIRILAHLFMHNLLNPDATVIPWGGYMPDQENATNALLHLFTLPVETSHTDATSHEYWFKESIFDKTIEVQKGKVKLVDGAGFGMEIDADAADKRLIREKSFS